MTGIRRCHTSPETRHRRASEIRDPDLKEAGSVVTEEVGWLPSVRSHVAGHSIFIKGILRLWSEDDLTIVAEFVHLVCAPDYMCI